MITFSIVPSGSFIMGGESFSTTFGGGIADSLPAHKVYIDSFKIGMTEVTNA